MYQVKRKGRVLKIKGRTLFVTYEDARSFLRAYLRMLVKNPKSGLNKGQFGYWDEISRNPSMVVAAGFRIERV